MNKMKIISGVSIFMLSILLNACKKDQVSTEMENALTENEANAALIEKSISAEEDGPAFRGPAGSCNWQENLPECAEVTESGDTYPKTITINYGNGCVDAHGNLKSGTVVITLSDEMTNIGAVRTVSFDNFVINESQIAGTRSTTNTGVNANGQFLFSRDIELVITKNAHTFYRNSNESITWLSGFETEVCGDNILQIEGSGTCSRDNGPVRTRTILTPLIMDHSCSYITSGIVSITGPNGTGSINFGDGSCDDVALVTRPNGTTNEIQLHGH